VAVGARIPKAEKSDGFIDCTASTKMLTFLLLVCMKLTPYAFIDKYRLRFSNFPREPRQQIPSTKVNTFDKRNATVVGHSLGQQP
jgi:hypothetical protein